MPSESLPVRLKELAVLFLRLGVLAFGGPAAHTAMMRQEVVHRKRWMSDEAFLDLVGACNLIPGPNSTELAIHIGHQRAGWRGLLIAGACFILPAAGMVAGLAWLYVQYGHLPVATHFLYGLKPVILAIVVNAVVGLSRTAFKSPFLWILGAAGLSLSLLGQSGILVLLGSGGVCVLFYALRNRWKPGNLSEVLPLLATSDVKPADSTPLIGVSEVGTYGPFVPDAVTVPLLAVFGYFLKVGSVLYGSGYVLVSFLQTDLVERYGWLTQRQLLDAVAIGQLTPGPVFTTATFIGYVLGGGSGAFFATLGIFLPSFVFVALTAPWIGQLRNHPTASHFLDGINVAAVVLMLVASIQLFGEAVQDGVGIALFAISLIALIAFQIHAGWLCLFGATAGMLMMYWQ